jgi:hypothetical protein
MLGYQDFYALQKSKNEEVLALYSKMEKKYSSIFTADKKYNKNFLFIRGYWYYMLFPSELRRQYSNGYQ